jgi:hypothetical protein
MVAASCLMLNWRSWQDRRPDRQYGNKSICLRKPISVPAVLASKFLNAVDEVYCGGIKVRIGMEQAASDLIGCPPVNKSIRCDYKCLPQLRTVGHVSNQANEHLHRRL